MNSLLRYFEEHPSLFIAIGAFVSALTAVAGFALKWWYRANKDRNELQIEVGKLNQELGQERAQTWHLMQARDQAQAEAQLAQATLDSVQLGAQEKESQLTKELEAAAERMNQMERREKSNVALVQRMLKLEGRLWEKRIHSGTPRFRPLGERKSAIISVLNLKGGVGKTTIASHLGAAFAQRGYRPLMVDTDLQGSLSSMFLTVDQLVGGSNDERLLQHFLSRAAHRGGLNALDFITPILDDRAGLIATSDKMAYAELNLTMHWLLRLGKRDTRFLLRRALHQRRVTRQYDVILLDCPPLINTCCVNALAASDYVLIPVTPSKKAAERVPQLLAMLREMRDRINPQIQPLGMILNRTHGHRLAAHEQDLWNQLQAKCQDQWGAPVYACQTHIRQMAEVRTNENQFAAHDAGSELNEYFQKLVLELEERLPRECRRTATTPV